MVSTFVLIYLFSPDFASNSSSRIANPPTLE